MTRLNLNTKLDAVNVMLGVIQQAPINSLTGDKTADVALAENILDLANETFQIVGWSFNSEEQYTLYKDNSGNIYVPLNALKIDTIDKSLKIVQRGTKLYNATDHTDVFTDDIDVNIVFKLDFVDLPSAAKNYVTMDAANKFQKRILASETSYAFTKEDLLEAFMILKEIEMANLNVNFNDNFPSTKAGF